MDSLETRGALSANAPAAPGGAASTSAVVEPVPSAGKTAVTTVDADGFAPAATSIALIKDTTTPDPGRSAGTPASKAHAPERSAPERSAGSAASPRPPVSQRKIDANRANARLSTGPRTPEGKARVSRNALRHGLSSQAALLAGEDAAEMAAQRQEYDQAYEHRTPIERALIGRIFAIEWKLQRLARVEVALVNGTNDERLRAWVDKRGRSMEGLPDAQRKMMYDLVRRPAPQDAAEMHADEIRTGEGDGAMERLSRWGDRLGGQLMQSARELVRLQKHVDAQPPPPEPAPPDPEIKKIVDERRRSLEAEEAEAAARSSPLPMELGLRTKQEESLLASLDLPMDEFVREKVALYMAAGKAAAPKSAQTATSAEEVAARATAGMSLAEIGDAAVFSRDAGWGGPDDGGTRGGAGGVAAPGQHVTPPRPWTPPYPSVAKSPVAGPASAVSPGVPTAPALTPAPTTPVAHPAAATTAPAPLPNRATTSPPAMSAGTAIAERVRAALAGKTAPAPLPNRARTSPPGVSQPVPRSPAEVKSKP